jgi:hypothetical protein
MVSFVEDDGAIFGKPVSWCKNNLPIIAVRVAEVTRRTLTVHHPYGMTAIASLEYPLSFPDESYDVTAM